MASRTITALAVVGALATLAGLATSLDYADHLLWLGDSLDRDQPIGSTSGEVVANVGGRAVLVVTETLACLLFTAIALALAAVRDRHMLSWIAGTTAIAKTVWLVASVAGNWDPGWYFILDPGKKGFAFWLFGLSILQAIGWFIAAATFARAPAR